MNGWAVDVTKTIGERVREFRGERPLQWLEDATGKLGFKVGRGAISRLENGKRESVSVAEWLTLAQALEVHPNQLLKPVSSFERVSQLGYEVAQATRQAFEAQKGLAREFKEFQKAATDIPESYLSEMEDQIKALLKASSEANDSMANLERVFESGEPADFSAIGKRIYAKESSNGEG